MTYNVFGGTLSLTQSINQPITAGTVSAAMYTAKNHETRLCLLRI